MNAAPTGRWGKSLEYTVMLVILTTKFCSGTRLELFECAAFVALRLVVLGSGNSPYSNVNKRKLLYTHLQPNCMSPHVLGLLFRLMYLLIWGSQAGAEVFQRLGALGSRQHSQASVSAARGGLPELSMGLIVLLEFGGNKPHGFASKDDKSAAAEEGEGAGECVFEKLL